MTTAPKPDAGQPQSEPTDEQKAAKNVQELNAADLDQVVGGATSQKSTNWGDSKRG